MPISLRRQRDELAFDNDNIAAADPFRPVVHFADCLAYLPYLEAGSVQLVVGDLPYGMTECEWDCAIDLTALWRELDRVLTPNGTAVMFASQPFTTVLGASNLAQLRSSLVWQKNRVNGFLHARNKVLKEHEDILIFSKGKANHPQRCNLRMVYNPQGMVEAGTKRVKRNRKTMIYLRDGKTGHAEGQKYQAAENFPRSILPFPKDQDFLHPTAKPVALLEWLIRTYSNPGDVVLDPTMGSGSTLVAARNAGRRSVGIEVDRRFFDIACERLFERS